MNVPENIRDRVQAEPGSITFPSARRPTAWVFAGLFGVGLLVVVACAVVLLGAALYTALFGGESAFMFAIQLLSLSFMPSIGAVCMGGVVGYSLSRTARPITVAGPMAVYGGLWAPKPVAVEALTLMGSPGRPIRLRSGKRLLARFDVTTRVRGWSYDNVTWVAQQCAANAGVELTDERPEEEWRRWESDPVFRGEAKFDARIEDNREKYSAHHATPPSPPRHRVDLDGMVVEVREGLFTHTKIRMDGTHLMLHGRSYALRDITRTGVSYGRHQKEGSSYWRGKLQIVVRGRIKTIADMRCESHGGTGAANLNWLAREILRQAQLAHPVRDRGTEEDVPESIAAMVGQRVEPPDRQ